MNTTTTVTKTEDKPITLDELRAAARRLVHKNHADHPPEALGLPTLEKEALAAIFETAFSDLPQRGPSYPDEFSDLGCFIAETSTDDAEDMDQRLLAMPFGYVDLIDRTKDKWGDPWLRHAARELVRAVAIYFVRMHAHSIVQCDRDEAADIAAGRKVMP
jgi:hypothetical protein